MKAGIIISLLIVLALLIGGLFLFDFGGNENSRINPENENLQGQNLVNQPETGANSETPATDSNSETSYVEIKNFGYSISELRIKTGDTVVWTNKDSVKHTVTSDSGSELDSSLLGKDEIYSRTFAESGTFDYHCTPHPYMKGKVIVQ